MPKRVRPADQQPPFPKERFITADEPSEENLEVDVLFVGGGPAGLAGAIQLAKLVQEDNASGDGIGEVSIGVLEKASALGEHSLSGAVINPAPFRTLFPDIAIDDLPFRRPVSKESVYVLKGHNAFPIPTPPVMRNHGNYIASLSEVVRWLGEQAEGLGVDIFAGFPAEKLLMAGDRVRGVRTAATGLDREGAETSNYMPPTDVVAKVTALAEGTRGPLAQAFFETEAIGADNPQVYALGVKEIWETKTPLDRIIHTMGWPLPSDAFGGSFMYPLEPNLVVIGLVVGLDYRQTGLDVHELLQRMKLHPLFRKYLEGGEMVEWGAKTIPEGGFYSIPHRRSGNGVVVLGDSLGLVNVPALKGVHYAMQSGMLAAKAIFDALKAGDTSGAKLAAYDAALTKSDAMKEIYRTRNMRLAFKDGFWVGGIKAGLMTISGGRLFGGRIPMEPDADVSKNVTEAESFSPDGKLTFSKVDAVFKSGNATRDTVPSHLIAQDVDEETAKMYANLCPAGVYEVVDGKLQINAPNCIDCKATDVLGPRWSPREGGSGPTYKLM